VLSYIQDYEPLFYPRDSAGWVEAARSYTLVPDTVLFAKTHWLCDIVRLRHGVDVHKVSPTTALGIPCATLREQTERPITVVEGTNRLVPWPISEAGVWGSVRDAAAEGRREMDTSRPLGWNGHAAERTVEALRANV
jgi:hypothetical protein